ncbi:hypothetical protein FACS189419_09150 [Planctomycetales bacterium]|nr:hypothetical protein FACS189419_09150 [Planctomycetales bacterium]
MGGGNEYSLAVFNSKVKLSEIPDGASNTITISENLEAVAWYSTGYNNAAFFAPNELGNGDAPTRSTLCTQFLGFVWTNHNVKIPNIPSKNAATWTVTDTQWESAYTPNRSPVWTGTGDPPVAAVPVSARPSSNHRGTVIVTYADGAVKPLDAYETDRDVYLRLVCPDDLNVTKSVADGGLGY